MVDRYYGNGNNRDTFRGMGHDNWTSWLIPPLRLHFYIVILAVLTYYLLDWSRYWRSPQSGAVYSVFNEAETSYYCTLSLQQGVMIVMADSG